LDSDILNKFNLSKNNSFLINNTFINTNLTNIIGAYSANFTIPYEFLIEKDIKENYDKQKMFTFITLNKNQNNSEDKKNVKISSEYYDVDNHFDQYQFAMNISEGCNDKNCKFPNSCLNITICACDNNYANFFLDENSTNKIDRIYCSYERKNQVLLSIFEVFLPGIGFILTGFYTYGIIKFLICSLLFSVIILKLARCFRKDRLPINSENTMLAEFKKDLHFYLMLISYGILVIWMIIDLTLISFRIRKDPNGIDFQIKQIFNKYS